jgi:hypothetical protein
MNNTNFTSTIAPSTNILNKMNGNFEAHPSVFIDTQDTVKQNVGNQRTLVSLTDERKNRIATSNLDKLESPGAFKFFGEDGDTKLSGSNTRFLFRNLYGETLLTYLFFSDDNINNIQKLIKMLVYKEMNKVIDNQSIIDLQIIMRSIFLSYSLHPKLIDESMSPQEKKALLIQYTNEVDRLNQLVINETVPLICSQLQQYLTYLSDASSTRFIMDKPKSDSVKGEKMYRSATNVLLGTPL